MAERRMFSAKVVRSGRFLSMPVSSRLLYYDLGMAGDDDGVVEAYAVMASTGATQDDLRVLVSKGFVKILNDDLVAYIMDWNENNRLRSDRKVDSIYRNLLLKMLPDVELVEPRKRADTGQTTRDHRKNGQPMVVQMTSKANGQPLDNQWTPQDRIGKDSTGKEETPYGGKEEKTAGRRFSPPSGQEVQEYLDSLGVRSFTGEGFCDHYTARGWMVGRVHMKDWKAAVRTWIRQDRQKGIDISRPAGQQKGAPGSVPEGKAAPVGMRDVTGQYDGDILEEAT